MQKNWHSNRYKRHRASVEPECKIFRPNLGIVSRVKRDLSSNLSMNINRRSEYSSIMTLGALTVHQLLKQMTVVQLKRSEIRLTFISSGAGTPLPGTMIRRNSALVAESGRQSGAVSVLQGVVLLEEGCHGYRGFQRALFDRTRRRFEHSSRGALAVLSRHLD